MEVKQTQAAEQQLILTQDMQQSLHILQLAQPDLREYLLEEALSNPLLAVEEPMLAAAPPARQPPADDDIPALWRRETHTGGAGGDVFLSLLQDESGSDLTHFLHEQLLHMPYLEAKLLPLCDYLIECLDEHGYLGFSLQELADVLHCPLFDLEQALYAVQSLEPTGVGARSLAECLLLQLAQSQDFNSHTLRLATQGLELLAKNDLAGIARFLGCSRRQAQQAADAVRKLNPRPVRGLRGNSTVPYQIPEAEIIAEDGRLRVEMNRGFLPRLHLDSEACELLRGSADPESHAYLRRCTRQAEQLMQCVTDRETTLERLLVAIIRRQSAYFLQNAALQPMTMRELAFELALSPSTVSRALRHKTVVFRGHSLPLKSLFSGSLAAADGQTVTAAEVQCHLRRFIQAEDKTHPLSDEALRLALEAIGLPVSRRTVAKYREELGIPSSSARRQK